MLDGAALPKGFQGGLDFAYATGPGPARVKMRVDSPMKKSIISNVVVTIPGSKYGTDEDRKCGTDEDRSPSYVNSFHTSGRDQTAGKPPAGAA
ncbi:hypothetical protein T484DRAFT_1801956 [Baffinella frigidus]|nr:hypothetical protein T484DRAFT_1801956 [Cryptophyta sp. CCMP2293]